jgi:hypothetical protein
MHILLLEELQTAEQQSRVQAQGQLSNVWSVRSNVGYSAVSSTQVQKLQSGMQQWPAAERLDAQDASPTTYSSLCTADSSSTQMNRWLGPKFKLLSTGQMKATASWLLLLQSCYLFVQTLNSPSDFAHSPII